MKKIFSLFVVALFAMSTMAVDWSTIGWVDNSNSKFKIGAEDDANLPGVINVQKPGWASENGIYMTFPAAGISCEYGHAVEGAGMVLYTGQFIARETEVTVTYSGGSKTFLVYYADGIDGLLKKNFNYAQGGTSTSSTGTAASGNDGNTGTRWESASADPQWWQVDLGQKSVFNCFQIVWEGAYAKNFTVSVSNDGESWTVAKSVEGQNLVGFPYTQTLDLDDYVAARYVRFDGTVRGTGYGYSFWEFRVMSRTVSVLTSLTLKAGASLAKVADQVSLTLTAKDQNGITMDAGEVEWIVTPSTAGHVTDGKYVADAAGAATVKAKVGEVESAAVSVFAYAGEVVSLSTNISTDNKIIAQIAENPNGSEHDAYYAIDNNEGSIWQGSVNGSTGDGEASRTYDSWFVIDLGAYYDIELVSVKFEGACSQNYTIDFATTYASEETDWTNAYTYAGAYGINGHTDYFYGNVLASSKVRYVRFFSTKAATQYGMKIYDMKVIGSAWVPSEDTEKPVMTSASLVSQTYNSAVIAVAATDNQEVGAYHVVDATHSIDVNCSATEGKITVGGLTASTTYNFTITALDLNSNESDNSAVVAVTTDVHYTAPQTAATVPTINAALVKKVFSDAFDGGEFTAHEGWDDATVYDAMSIDEDNIRKYTNLNWLGWQGLVVASDMQYLHIDIWAELDATLGIVPIYGGDGLTTDDSHRKVVSLVGQQWNSFDLVLATDFAGLDLSSIFQFKFDQNSNQANVYAIDNVYFWKEGYVRDVTSGNYGTICLPKAATLTGATAYEIVGATASSISLAEVANLQAGVPYIFQASADQLVATLAGDAAAATTANGLVGSFTGCDVAEGMYVISNNSAKLCGTGCTIAANRAYINMSAIVNTGAPAHRVITVAEGTDVATALENANAENVQKFIENGQLIIIKNGVRYNALGQIVK